MLTNGPNLECSEKTGLFGREAPNKDFSHAKLSRDCSEIQLAQDFDGYRAFRVPENERVVEFTGRSRVEQLRQALSLRLALASQEVTGIIKHDWFPRHRTYHSEP